jgi:hypothetical protein
MTTPSRAGVIAIAAIALGLSLTACGSDTKTEAATTSAAATSKAAATSSAAPSSATPAAGKNQTIEDYVNANGIVATVVHRGDPGSPAIDLPFPPGWEDLGAKAPADAWGGIFFADPAAAKDPSKIIAIMNKLTGNVDPNKILELAKGELKNIPGFEGGDGQPSNLGGFDAWQIGGTYAKNGGTRLAAQKTVVVPGQDGLYVLQLNADGPEDQAQPLMEATSAIDEQTKITP